MSPTSASTPHLPDSDEDDQSPDDSEVNISTCGHTIRIPPSRAWKASPSDSLSTTVSEMVLEHGESFLRVKELKAEEEEELLDDECVEVVEEPAPKQHKPHKSAAGSKKVVRSGMRPPAIGIELTDM